MDEKTRQAGQLNIRVISFTLGSVVVAGIAVLLLKSTEPDRLKAGAMDQAGQLVAKGRGDLAIRHLDLYLELDPTDVEALELKARLLADSTQDAEGILYAAQVNDRLLRLDPDSPGRQITRQRLAELYIRYSDAYRSGAAFRNAPESASHELRYRAAEAIARQMIAREAGSATAWRLLGMSLQGLAVPGDPEALAGSVGAYEESLRLDPAQIVAAGRLAGLYRERLADPARSEKVLSTLLRSGRDRVEIRLARYDHYVRSSEPARAEAELREALRLDPHLASVRLTAASDALRRGELKEGRIQIEAIAEAERDNPRVRLVWGMIDFAEQRYDEAIKHWRVGLAKAGGTDAVLTWWLAYALLQMDRVPEARSIANQYHRIVGDDKDHLNLLLKALLDERLGKPRLAIANLERIREPVGEMWRSVYYLALGRCYEATWDEGQALAAYRKAVKSDPTSAVPRLALAKFLMERRPDEAIAELKSAAVAIPTDPTVRTTLAAVLLRKQSRLPASRRSWAAFDKAWNEAASVAPGHPAVLLLQARRRSLGADPKAALALLEKATRNSPHDPAIWVAYAGALHQNGKPDQAERALDAAAAPAAVGDRAAIRIARARLLTAVGRGREGRGALVRDLDRLPPSDRVLVREASGRLLAIQGDIDGARNAYSEWAHLVPESPGPRIALLELALASSDEAMIRSTVASLRDLESTGEATLQLCRVLELLQVPPTGDASAGFASPALIEAETLLDGLSRTAPDVPAVALLQGQAAERLGRVDEAVANYRRAWQAGIGVALPRLIDLLVRNRRIDDLAKLRQSGPDGRIDAFLTRSFSQIAGAPGLDQLLAATDPDSDASFEARTAWVGLLTAAGKLDEVEAKLAALANETPSREAPWMDLLRFRAEHGRLGDLAATIDRIKAGVKSSAPEVLEARCRWIVGDRSGSDRAFSKAASEHPNDPAVQLAVASYFQETNRPASAVARLRRVLELDPHHCMASRQLALSSSEIATNATAWEQAWTAFGPESADPEDRLARAVVLSRCTDPARCRGAIARLDDLLADLTANHPVAVAAREALIRLLLRTGEPSRACELASVSAAMGFDPRSIATYVEALLQNRMYDRAEQQLNLWAANVPGNRREAQLRTRLIVARSRPEAASLALERAFLDRGKGPSAGVLGREVALLLTKMGPDARPIAERIAQRLVSNDPGCSWVPARIALRSGRRDEALKLCTCAIDAGTKPDIHEAALVATEVATAKEADTSSIDRAISLLEAAARRDPGSVELLTLTAMVRHRQGLYKREADLYRTVLAQQAGHATALNNLAWVLSEDLHRPAEALAVIDELIRDVGPAPQAPCTRSAILLRLGRVPEATHELEAVARRNPSALCSYYLALAYCKAGRDADSRRSLDAAMQAGLTMDALDPPLQAEFEAIVASHTVPRNVPITGFGDFAGRAR